MIRVFNTLSKTKEPLHAKVEGEVGIYTCGPTVYNYIHIGNARTFLTFDMIRKYLEYRGLQVNFVQNITDVDDKIIKRAAEEESTPEEVARAYTQAFLEDMGALGVDPPTHMPKATEFIGKMIEMIENLVARDHAYFAGGDVFYAVNSLPDYGKLSRRSLDEMRAGERVEIDERKRHPMDFVLWKASKPGEPFWDSPWGPGRPGWHIECSAMSLHHLGEAFDIHGGAQDLIFPHHENEIAQSEGALGSGKFAQQWLHAGLLQIDREKMSKSVGNIALLRDLLKEWTPQTIRMLMLRTHYRQPLDFSDEGLAESREAYRRFEELLFTIDQLELREAAARAANPDFEEPSKDAAAGALALFLGTVEASFQDAMDDDFNSAEGLAVLFELVKRANTCIAAEKLDSASALFFSSIKEARSLMGRLLGVLGVNLESVSQVLPSQSVQVIDKLAGELGIAANGEVEHAAAVLNQLIAERDKAREAKDWSKADLIRDGLREAGVALIDTGFGPQWKLSES